MKQPVVLFASLCFLASEAMQVQNAQNSPKAYVVSDAHLDTQWNWDIQTTIQEYVWNTLNQNLFLLRKYPDYVFNFEGAVKYSWMKEYFPTRYEELKQRVKEGRWHVTGSSWADFSAACSIFLNFSLFMIFDFGVNYSFASLANFSRASAISTARSGVKVATASGSSSPFPYPSTRKYTSEGAGLSLIVVSLTPTVKVAPSCLKILHGKNAVFFLFCFIVFFI